MKIHDILDRIGVFASGLCVVHCLALPVLILLLPFCASFLRSESFHIVLCIILVPLAFYALWSGYRSHKNASALCLGIPGTAFIAVGAFSSMLFGTEAYETILTVPGSILLISAHFFNLRWKRKANVACQCGGHHSHTPPSK